MRGIRTHSRAPRFGVIPASLVALSVVSCTAGGVPPAATAQPASPTAAAAGQSLTAAQAPVPVVVQPSATGAQPQRGGTFALSVRTAPTIVHPFNDTGLGNTITLSGVYEPLVRYDYSGDFRDQYKLVPGLAESWERTDPLTYVFHLRKSVKFHDGSEMTSEDVVWSFEYLRDPANNFRRAPQLRQADKITAVDPYTIQITTRAVSPTFLDDLVRYAVILPRKAFDRGVNFDKEAIGTGPFKLQSWDARSGAVLVRHEEYWDKGKPYIDRIRMNYNMDPSAMIAAFATGQNDVIKVSDKPQYDSAKSLSPSSTGESFPLDISDHISFNVTKAPLDDVRVRRAIHLGLDRQQMLDTLTFGLGTINPPGMNGARRGGWAIPQDELLKLPGYNPATRQQDIAEARRLLAEAGFVNPNGLKLTLTYNSGFTRFAGEAEMVASQLKAIGVQIALDPKEEAVARRAEQDGTYEITFGQFSYGPESDWAYWLHTRGRPNSKGANDADLDHMIDAQKSEQDVDKRKAQWIAIQQYLLDKAYTVGLVTQVGFIAFQPYVHDWGDNRAGQAVNMAWENTWLEQSRMPAGR